ncbi:3-dehydroquinate synthase [Phycisphaerales bacterium]|nr:3-dehydroquinate synthase [Phycisphaerales bacterium]
MVLKAGTNGAFQQRCSMQSIGDQSFMHRRELEFEQHRTTILIGRGLLGRARDLLVAEAGLATDDRVHLAIDSGPDGIVVDRHGRVLEAALASGSGVSGTTLEATESAKSVEAVERLWDGLRDAGVDRQGLLMALGGGIVCDIAGFAASGWMRGIDLVLAPTTLLAMVDAAIGGKTGVNRPLADGGLGKNLVGAFWPARLVICDCDVLSTLGSREFRAGLAECLKHALIDGEESMNAFERELPSVLERDAEALPDFVARSAGVKASIVRRDPREAGERALLNLGHTYAHALESRVDLGLLHGEAVSLGLVAASRAAREAGMLADDGLEIRVRGLLQQCGLPTALPAGAELDPGDLRQVMALDKKSRSGRIRLVLPRAVGRIEVVEGLPDGVVDSGWAAISTAG